MRSGAERRAGEISYDLVMGEEMEFVEGTYRVNGGEWRVFVFLGERLDVFAQPAMKATTWASGVKGFVFRVPRNFLLNKKVVEFLLGEAERVERWQEVKGPDSMALR